MRRDEVEAAAQRLAGVVRRTPLLTVAADELGLDGDRAPVVCKLDMLQPTGSFKVRGATALLTDPALQERIGRRGVLAASGGNFGLAVAWAARRQQVAATIVVPASSPPAKREPIAALGAELVVVDGVYADAAAEAERRVRATGAMAAHPYDQRPVVAGQGTATLELLADEPAVDTILVACGGGGLLAGTLAAADGSAAVVAVETEGTATLAAAIDAGAPVDVDVSGPAASALGARRIGAHAWAARDQLAGNVVVSDAEVADAQRRLWSSARLIAEPGGATALAALTSGRYQPAPGERIAVVICGANTDPATVLSPGP